MTDDLDDLDDLLGPTPPTPGHDRVKDAVLRSTTRRLAWTRWARRGRTAVAAAAAFAVGGAAGWFAKPTADVPPASEPVVYPVPVPLFVSPDAPPVSPGEVYVSAERVELQAEQATDQAEAARLYRLAGARFEERAEYGQARRCYRLHLLAAGPDGRAVSTDDSWLLITVKTSQKETDRDPKQGS